MGKVRIIIEIENDSVEVIQEKVEEDDKEKNPFIPNAETRDLQKEFDESVG